VTTRAALQWIALLASGAGVALLLHRAGLPAPWLIGPILVALVAAVGGLVALRVPRPAFVAAQAAIGMLIAQTFTPPVVASIARSWAVVLAVIASTIVAAAVAGWILARVGSIPAPTAALGSSPGGASAMTAMSAEYGADPRIVAFMQYLRVTVVVLSASAVSRVLLGHAPALPAGALGTASGLGLDLARGDLTALLETIAVAAIGAFVALRLKVPAGALLGPMVLGAALHGAGLVRIVLPAAVLDAAYLTIGLTIGLLYTPATVRYVLRVLPQLLAATVVLVLLCCGSAALLVATLHVDALTAYLATTPGGLDSVTVIALSSGANAPLVLAIQALRLFVVLLTAPTVAKLIVRIA
jgi:membrane AbrB-like protein